MARRFTERKSFSEIEKMSISELRKEYTTLRDIFQKRVKRLYKAGDPRASAYMPGGELEIYKLSERPQKRPYLQNPEVDQRAALAYEVKLLTDLIGGRERGLPSAGTFSLTGFARQRRERDLGIVSALHEAGYEHISKTTLRGFGRFMDKMREKYGKKLPNSEEMAEFFDSLKYNTKRRSTQFIVDLWEDFERNGYKPDYGSVDLFAR